MTCLAEPSAETEHFLAAPLRALAEMVDRISDSTDFALRVDELHALSDAELTAMGLRRSRIAHHVFTELSRA
ncbi:MAG: hypothetical protein KDA50_02790 [Rhodobacteraceae bacterium]|nr:hypothetical protein [Paracoccaceae bacterium]